MHSCDISDFPFGTDTLDMITLSHCSAAWIITNINQYLQVQSWELQTAWIEEMEKCVGAVWEGVMEADSRWPGMSQSTQVLGWFASSSQPLYPPTPPFCQVSSLSAGTRGIESHENILCTQAQWAKSSFPEGFSRISSLGLTHPPPALTFRKTAFDCQSLFTSRQVKSPVRAAKQFGLFSGLKMLMSRNRKARNAIYDS